jgi:hypothetical protein
MAWVRRVLTGASATLLPPIAAAFASWLVYLESGGESRCLESVRDSPGLQCAPGIHWLMMQLVFPVFHLVLTLPLALWIRWKFRPGRRVSLLTCAGIATAESLMVASHALLHRLPPAADEIMVVLAAALCFPLALLLLPRKV